MSSILPGRDYLHVSIHRERRLEEHTIDRGNNLLRELRNHDIDECLGHQLSFGRAGS